MNLRELRWLAIVSACGELQQDMIRRAFTGMVHRVTKCIEVDGRAFSDEWKNWKKTFSLYFLSYPS